MLAAECTRPRTLPGLQGALTKCAASHWAATPGGAHGGFSAHCVHAGGTGGLRSWCPRWQHWGGLCSRTTLVALGVCFHLPAPRMQQEPVAWLSPWPPIVHPSHCQEPMSSSRHPALRLPLAPESRMAPRQPSSCPRTPSTIYNLGTGTHMWNLHLQS